MGWDPPVEVDRERLERLFPPGAADPGVRAAELLQVPHGQVEDFEGGLFGGELAPVAGHLAQPGVHALDQVRNRYEDLRRRRSAGRLPLAGQGCLAYGAT